jgi:hypothetical protein
MESERPPPEPRPAACAAPREWQPAPVALTFPAFRYGWPNAGFAPATVVTVIWPAV